jgi:methylmalonyl-CoA/ethylmalonyl-CoA epimerase
VIKKFDHVGLVVKNTPETAALFSKLFGLETEESRTETAAGFKSTLMAKEDLSFELIEPVGDHGVIQKFVEKRGGGLHHISIQVSDIYEEVKRLQGLGVQFSTEKPMQVTETTKVIFIHPRSTDGLLIELIERIDA